MRPHGRARILEQSPSALGICDRCGFMYNHSDLQWQHDWRGPRLQNLRILVCEKCLDVPQEQLRTITLPADPQPIDNPRPEQYVPDNNPLSPIGYDPANLFFPQSQRGANIGNMTLNAGVDAAFDGSVNKRAEMSAALAVSNSSFQNTVGKNWNADPSGVSITLPSTVTPSTYVVSSFTATAPNDAKFFNGGATGYLFQGSQNGSVWTNISSGTTAGTVGEILTVTSTSGAAYAYHQFVLQGDGFNSVAIAQLAINVSNGPPNDV